MESSSNCGKSVCESKNSPNSSPILGLSNDLSDKLVINGGSTMNNANDVQKRPVVGYYIEEEEVEEEDDFSEEELLAQMGYGKLEPRREIKKEHKKQYYDEEDEENEEEEEEEEDGLHMSEESLLAQMGYLKKEPPKHEPITTPTAALSLVSALKGSREKEGKPASECRVSWAPDVYDPPPSSAEHFAKTNTERHKSEHRVKGVAGKNRQKTGGKGAGGIESGVGGGKESKGGGHKGTAGGVGKVGVKDKDKKVKKHTRGASKYSNFDDS